MLNILKLLTKPFKHCSVFHIFSLQINIGLMTNQKDGLKPQLGKTVSLKTDPDVTATTLLNQAVKKMKDFNKDLKEGPFLLLYPDSSEVINIPGTQRPFTLEAYKTEVGKSYQRITLFICLKRDFEEGKLSCLCVEFNTLGVIFNT